jgi:hypothetical protein
MEHDFVLIKTYFKGLYNKPIYDFLKTKRIPSPSRIILELLFPFTEFIMAFFSPSNYTVPYGIILSNL